MNKYASRLRIGIFIVCLRYLGLKSSNYSRNKGIMFYIIYDLSTSHKIFNSKIFSFHFIHSNNISNYSVRCYIKIVKNNTCGLDSTGAKAFALHAANSSLILNTANAPWARSERIAELRVSSESYGV